MQTPPLSPSPLHHGVFQTHAEWCKLLKFFGKVHGEEASGHMDIMYESFL